MEERALGRGWLLPQEKRDRIARRLLKALKSDNERYALGAAKTLVSADLKQQEIDLRKRESDASLDDALDDALGEEDPPAAGEVPG